MTTRNTRKANTKVTLVDDGSSSEEANQVTTPKSRFPIVGIGASAGGLAAFEAFFSSIPVDTNPEMAFVLVQHLDPNRKSILAELIKRYTSMQVFEVEDGMEIQINCVYIIPPNRDMAFLNGTLQLLEPAMPRGLRLPIDFFFRSMAQDLHEQAIVIVLSGTGSDGTLGVRAIKGEGGMVMVQNPASTEFDGMPLSALATGAVDFELPPAEMFAQLVAYVYHASSLLRQPPDISSEKAANLLMKIFVLVRAQTGHDFSQYKQNTIFRRIERRMAINQIINMDAYVKYLQRTPEEVDDLFHDLLIGVTSFFRDPDAFLALETLAIPKLFANKLPDAPIRIWTAGCSTGEEAYSIAILVKEHMDKLRIGNQVQIFATDIDALAIATARAGIFPASIATDIAPERLARFFSNAEDDSHYRIQKAIRDMLIFSEQDIIKDPPFSNIDLVSCRNVLIYLNKDLQEKVIHLFNYALHEKGMLFLGSCESLGELDELFSAEDRKAKLFTRKQEIYGRYRVISSKLLSPAYKAASPLLATRKPLPPKQPLRELTEKELLLQVAPSCALVNAQGDILYLHGRTGMFLEPSPGETGTSNVLKMAREGLKIDLYSALKKAKDTLEIVHVPGLRVKTNGHFILVNLTVRPVTGSADSPLYLVIMEEAPFQEPAQTGAPETSPASDANARISELEQALHIKDQHIMYASEELESVNEELKSTNEELQSNNEELQATNEELETTKEELQSINEELSTVNTELQLKVLDLTQTNNDMINLLAGTGVGTIFVDLQLRVMRFTSSASAIINLIQTDLGRPVSHIVYNLVNYHNLVADVQSVLDTLIPREIEVQTSAGNWFMMRILPYRTLNNIIEGAVITFIDITETVQARKDLLKVDEMARLAVVLRDANDAITMQDLTGRILAWNPGAVRLYGWNEAEALNIKMLERIPSALHEEELARIEQLKHGEILQPYLTQRLTQKGEALDVWVTATALLNEDNHVYTIATTEQAVKPESKPAK